MSKLDCWRVERERERGKWDLLQLGGVTRYVMEDSCGYVCLHSYMFASLVWILFWLASRIITSCSWGQLSPKLLTYKA